MNEGELLEFDDPKKLIQNKESYFYKLWLEYEHDSDSSVKEWRGF